MKKKVKNVAAGIKTTIFLFCLVLFSKELFSDTRLSQLSTGGVQLHIEDCQAGVQRSSWEKKLLKMQNEPNLQTSPVLLTTVIAGTYNEKPHLSPKPTNPIEPKANPTRTQFPPTGGPSLFTLLSPLPLPIQFSS